MRNVLILFSLLLALVLLGPFAQAQDQDLNLEPAVLSTGENWLRIKTSAHLYEIADPDLNDQALFRGLSEKEQDEFRRNRAAVLGQAARALTALRWGFGVGSLLKDRLVYAVRPFLDARLDGKIESLGSGMREDAFAARARRLAERARTEDQWARFTMKEKSTVLIDGILKSIDRSLWAQAPLFAHSNEFGLMASVGLQAEGGVDKKGWGGLFDLGISIGYNRDTKAFVFQIYRDFERFKSTSMKAVFVAGVVGKAGSYVSNVKTGELKSEGTSFYPPMIPGFSSLTSRTFMTGFSSALAVPPPPFADILTYTNTLKQKTILRIAVSPLLKGFVRMETGLGLESLTFAIEPVQNVVNSVRAWWRGHGLCRSVFLQ